MGGEEVKLLGRCTSPYSRRVEIALKIKGVQYEYIEQDLKNKSELLLKSNPIYKNIPVLLHNGNPIVDNQIILEYIDDTWKSNPIFPQDPYNRAIARFWCKFIDEKVTLPGRQTALAAPGEASERAEKLDKEKLESLKILEKQLNGNKFFGGDKFDVVDITAIGIAAWCPALQEASGRELVTVESFPEIMRWSEDILSCDVIKENVPSKDQLVAVFKADILRANCTSPLVSQQNNISPLSGVPENNMNSTDAVLDELPGDDNKVSEPLVKGGGEIEKDRLVKADGTE